MFAYGTFAELTFAQEPRSEKTPPVQALQTKGFPTEYISRKRKKRKEAHEEREEIALALAVAMDGPMADPAYAARVRAREEDDVLLIAALM